MGGKPLIWGNSNSERQLSTNTLVWEKKPLYGEKAIARDNYQLAP
jgi:hypothetical protein